VVPPLVAVIDDDPGVRVALERLLRSMGLEAVTYGSALDFLAESCTEPSCLVVDVQMPEMTGLELQQVLIDSGRRVPIVLITAHEETEPEEIGLRRGAYAFLRKPFTEEQLLDALTRALPEGSL
jgi:FixJ family two-component response regulator